MPRLSFAVDKDYTIGYSDYQRQMNTLHCTCTIFYKSVTSKLVSNPKILRNFEVENSKLGIKS